MSDHRSVSISIEVESKEMLARMTSVIEEAAENLGLTLADEGYHIRRVSAGSWEIAFTLEEQP